MGFKDVAAAKGLEGIGSMRPDSQSNGLRTDARDYIYQRARQLLTLADGWDESKRDETGLQSPI